MDNIIVLMSTYNGEKYLHEQLKSIVNQLNVNPIIYIRDDGSSDKTIEIIEEYQKKYPITLIKGENIGVGNSFMELLYLAPTTYQYYCFSDQDDIWLHDKLYHAILKIKNKSTPCLYASNQTLVDSTLHNVGQRYKHPPDYSYQQIICRNYLSGCTMVWNKQLHCLLQDTSRRPSYELLQNRIHDVWVALVASVIGEIIYDVNSYILYRQHENNVVGARKDSFWNNIKEKYYKIINPSQRCGRSRLCMEVLQKYSLLLGDKTETFACYSYYSKSIKNKLELLNRRHVVCYYSKENQIAFCLKVLLGLF